MSRNTITVGRRGYLMSALAPLLMLATFGARAAGTNGFNAEPVDRANNAPNRRQNPPAFQGEGEKARRRRQAAALEAKRAARGMTLFELMVGVAILAVVVSVGAWGCSLALSGPKQQRTAESEARAWAEGMGVKLLGVSCADIDSDGDGYVSCMANVEGQGTVPIECRGAYSVGHGCRSPKLRIPAQPGRGR